MPNKVFLHPVPYLISFCTLIAGILANLFGLGPQYTYPFALLVLILTGVNASFGGAHGSWVIDVPASWLGTLVPVISTLSGIITALVPALTGPGSPYHFSVVIVATLTATVLVLNWLAQALQSAPAGPPSGAAVRVTR